MTDPVEIIICHTRNGKAVHALHVDCKTVLGPWTDFESADALDKTLIYLGATEEQMEAHRAGMQQCGQGSSHIRLMPNRRNLLRIDYTKL